MLVAAVLRPEEREDRQLEVVRLPLEQVDDASELAIREAEGPVYGDRGQRLCGDTRQVSQCNREGRRRPPRCEEA